MPFGKYKGQPIERVVTEDHKYVDWLCGEPWFWEKFAGSGACLETEGRSAGGHRRRQTVRTCAGSATLSPGDHCNGPGRAAW
jgi:hypothetical protein